jgi:hypothetical protein
MRFVLALALALVLGAVLPAIAAAAIAPDAYEVPSDDAWIGAKAIAPGQTQNRTIDDLGSAIHTTTVGGFDEDWVYFNATAGRYYEFETTGTVDTFVSLVTADGQHVITWNDDKGDGSKGSYVGWVPQVSGKYYVWIQGWTDGITSPIGAYTLTAGSNAAIPPPAVVGRADGANRYAVAESAAKIAFPGWKRSDGKPVSDVIIACGEDRAAADPLAAAALAGLYEAPVLLVPTRADGAMPLQTTRPLSQMKTVNGGKLNIHIVGGTGSVTSATQKKLAAYRGTGAAIERFAGRDRYETAGLIADRVDNTWAGIGWATPVVFIADGAHPGAFWDALAAGPLLYNGGVPLLLTNGATVPSTTRGRLNTRFLDASERWVVNASVWVPDATARAVGAVAPDASIRRITKSSVRSAAARDIAQWGFDRRFINADVAGFANKLPDSLTGGSALGQMSGPLLFTDYGSIPTATKSWLQGHRGSVYEAYVFGGTASVSTTVRSGILYTLTH